MRKNKCKSCMFSINRFSSYLIFYFLGIYIFQKSNSAHFKTTGFPSTKAIFKCRWRLTSLYWAYIFNSFLMEPPMIYFGSWTNQKIINK